MLQVLDRLGQLKAPVDYKRLLHVDPWVSLRELDSLLQEQV